MEEDQQVHDQVRTPYFLLFVGGEGGWEVVGVISYEKKLDVLNMNLVFPGVLCAM